MAQPCGALLLIDSQGLEIEYLNRGDYSTELSIHQLCEGEEDRCANRSHQTLVQSNFGDYSLGAANKDCFGRRSGGARKFSSDFRQFTPPGSCSKDVGVQETEPKVTKWTSHHASVRGEPDSSVRVIPEKCAPTENSERAHRQPSESQVGAADRLPEF